MRSKVNLHSSTDRHAEDKLSRMPLAGLPLSRLPLSDVPMSRMPMEWLDAGSWRLPSGKALAEFALQAGFLAPLLFRVERFGGRSPRSGVPGSMRDAGVASRAKEFGKGGQQ
jgi:hypothetical protein